MTKPHNKTPYELLLGKTPSIGFTRPFGCPVTFLNTLDPLGKFDRKADEGFLVGYSVTSKAFRVFNSRTRIVQETLHINFLKNQPNVAGSRPTWLFDINPLNLSMNYQSVVTWNQPNHNAGIQENLNAGNVGKETVSSQQYVLLPLWSTGSKDPQNINVDAAFDVKDNDTEVPISPSSRAKSKNMMKRINKKLKERFLAPVTAVGPNSTNSTNSFNAAGPSDNAVSPNFEIGGKYSFVDPSLYPDDPNMPALKDIVYLDDAKDVGAEADFSNLETSITVNPIPTTKVHKDHPVTQIIGDLTSAPQTRSMERMVKEQEPKRVHQALKDPSWFEAMQEELLQFKMQKVWALVDVPKGNIEEEVYVCQPLGFEDPDYPDKLYKVVKALYGLHQALRGWYETLANYLLKNGFPRGKINQTLFIKKQKGDILLVQVKQKDDRIFISQDKYVAKILRKFGLTDGKSDSTPIDTKKPLLKDPDGEDVDVQIYWSMIGSLMYLTSSKPDIIFTVCACARFQVTPKASYLLIITAVSYTLMLFGLTKDDVHLMMLGHNFSLLIITTIIMAPLTFADTHNMITFLTKSDASEGFDKIVDFLNAHTIQHALMVNPPIYVLCIKQFWASVSVKKTHDVVKLQALIDRKKVVITEDSIRQALRLDDAAGVECLPNEEIFTELARMGYEKPPPKLTFYKAFFSAQWKFIIHTIVQCMSSKRTAWNEFISSMASAIICLATECFANMRRIGKGFSRVETLLFDTMLVQPQVQDDAEVEEAEDDNEKVAHLEEDKVAQALEITKLKQRVRKLEKKRRSKSSGLKRLRNVGGKIVELDANEDVTLVDVDTAVEMDDDTQGRMEEDVTVVKKVNAAELTVFDDEEVTMTMAQTLIKMKSEKQRILDEQMTKRLQDEETKQMQGKHLDNINKYQSLKRKPISVAQARKNMIVYLKNMVGYKIQHFKGMNYDQVRPIFKREYNHVQTFLKSDRDEEPTKKRAAKETLLQESFKKLRVEVKVLSSSSTQQDTPTVDPTEISKEDVQNMLQIVPMAEFKVEALQVKYSLIKWEIYSKGSSTYWKIIRVGGITQMMYSGNFKDTCTVQLCGSCILIVEYTKYLQQQEGGNNTEASGSASRQPQQVEPTVGQDGLGRSGGGVVIGLSVTNGQGGAVGTSVSVGSQVSDNGKFPMVDEEDLIFKKISHMAEEIMVMLREGFQKEMNDIVWYTNEIREHAEKIVDDLRDIVSYFVEKAMKKYPDDE
nr:hypothetical protein [Tanacetum cinerariifolium]